MRRVLRAGRGTNEPSRRGNGTGFGGQYEMSHRKTRNARLFGHAKARRAGSTLLNPLVGYDVAWPPRVDPGR